jgi:hypothetical protein
MVLKSLTSPAPHPTFLHDLSSKVFPSGSEGVGKFSTECLRVQNLNLSFHIMRFRCRVLYEK